MGGVGGIGGGRGGAGGIDSNVSSKFGHAPGGSGGGGGGGGLTVVLCKEKEFFSRAAKRLSEPLSVDHQPSGNVTEEVYHNLLQVWIYPRNTSSSYQHTLFSTHHLPPSHVPSHCTLSTLVSHPSSIHLPPLSPPPSYPPPSPQVASLAFARHTDALLWQTLLEWRVNHTQLHEVPHLLLIS